MDRLASMAAFVKTAEAGSFAAAAGALGISPQMVAKHVGWLESRLGARLIHRTTRRQSLTEIGKAYCERCRTVLADADWADAVADDAKGAPRGRLRVNAPVSFGTHTLVPVIGRYLRAYPEVEIDLVLNDRFVDLVEEEFEAVFRIGPLADSSFVARALAPFRLVACASPAYLQERGVPVTPADLDRHACLAYAWGAGAVHGNWQFTRDGAHYKVDIRHRLRLNDAKALLVAAVEGIGIAFISDDLARADLRAGRLVQVLPDYETLSRPVHLLYHPDRRQTPKLKSFIAAVVSELGLAADGA
jgi:DNA-binding transcriptional LysR family regulator